ncbi:MAG: membrane protein insertion efficiency factor YidD [Rhodospirillaceae bacterium]|nr:membrane protein insertion efficiency factor YidD [Rhodospirillaceae bacterium]
MMASVVGTMLRALIWLYQALLSPLIGPACRFTPSCSRYAAEAIGRFGPWTGTWLALKRIGRCHPWGGAGHDPVPDHAGCTHSHAASSQSTGALSTKGS